MDSNIFLAKSLKKLGLVAPVALAVGVLSSPVLAGFSAINEPLKSDSFVGVGVATEASGVAGLGGFNPLDLEVFAGQNFFSQDGLVAGAVASISAKNAAEKFALEDGGLTAFVAFNGNPEGQTGLKLGASVGFFKNFSEVLEDKASAPAARQGDSTSTFDDATKASYVTAKVDQSFTLDLADLGGQKVFLTQFAGVAADKKVGNLAKTDKEITAKAAGGVKLSTKFGAFSPILVAKVEKDLTTKDAAKGKVFPSIGGGVGFDVADFASLGLSVTKRVGSKTPAGDEFKVGLGLSLLF